MQDELKFKIPVFGWPANAGDYHNVPFDAADPRGAEPLVKLADHGIAGENYYARTDGQNWPYNQVIEGSLPDIWARRSIAEKLVSVNRILQPYGVELFVFDAYRPVECQKGLWKFFWAEAARLKPNADEAELRDYVLNYVSDPSLFDAANARTWPVHACGGAVDLTLRKIGSGDVLDMGARFDEMDPVVYSDALERKLVAHTIAADDPRLWNRRLLHWAMTQEGFINYPFEFWHFNFGDQMYALHARLLGRADAPEAAWYGYIPPPEG
jgi:D-alanyl-D-alanine dipeptidase